ncbi:MAG: TRNA ligase [Parcubacteria group bacterium Gr01-1014_30]|nr:MAG: TRNA ligase [Parcubacteria group bacterium Gr01-1014_30]
MTEEHLALIDRVNPQDFHSAARKLRNFFDEKGFIEVPVQHRLSILAACEDPRTIGLFMYMGDTWPLPQTGQMWLEYELLTKPDSPGYYCISYSYREEPNPIPGRHNLIFPMFEFETHGGIKVLEELEEELLESLGFGQKTDFHKVSYRDAMERYKVQDIGAEEEKRLAEEFGRVVFLTDFPEHTSPFWNMKREAGCAKKIDVLLDGVETIGSAERSADPEQMRKNFFAISDGMYSQILFSKFRKERVEKELESFLSLNFFARCGGGIGVTRLIRALKLANLLN